MARKLLTIQYDGTDYSGWQVQENARSVQSVLESVLRTVITDLKGITGCSRTDAGVHANMYCLHFDTKSSIENERIVAALNSRLPEDISALDCKTVADDFHARYSCKAKTYIYKIRNSSIPNPFTNKYELLIAKKLDENLLDYAAKKFIGTYDFAGFCSAGSSVSTTVRTVTDASVKRDGDVLTFSITADGFLYNMVRIIVGTLISVGFGKIDADDITDIINSKDRNRAGATARPHGLSLYKVYYDFKEEQHGC